MKLQRQEDCQARQKEMHMIKSMTGFGRGAYEDDSWDMTAEIKSVNHRYSDISVRMPRHCSFAEEPIKAIVKQVAPRGKIDVFLRIETKGEAAATVSLNIEVARHYYDSLSELNSEFDLNEPVTLSLLAGMPDVIRVSSEVEDEQMMLHGMSQCVLQAVENLDVMRIKEGRALAEDILSRCKVITDIVEEIETIVPDIVKIYASKLKERIEEFLANGQEVPQDRILLEAAVFADRSNVTEELVRLKSHAAQLRSFVTKTEGPIGKKLDFLVQEMNREANTIGSKVSDIDVTNRVVSLKSEIEIIREQIQNIE